MYLVTQTVRFSTHFKSQFFLVFKRNASMDKRQVNSEWPNKLISESSLYLPLPEVPSKPSPLRFQKVPKARHSLFIG
jgi:hypothetical protein